jgi:hypothetical protein
MAGKVVSPVLRPRKRPNHATGWMIASAARRPRSGPAYCPHLNPVERLWASVHQFVTHNRHDQTQNQFANAILTFFRETLPKEWKTFRSRVSDSFRVVTHEEFRAVG